MCLAIHAGETSVRGSCSHVCGYCRLLHLWSFVLLQSHGSDMKACHVCNHVVHDAARDSSGSHIVEDPGGLSDLRRRNGAASNGPTWGTVPRCRLSHPRTCCAREPCVPRPFWSEPCDFFPFCTPFRVLPVLCRSCLREMRSDLQTFRLVWCLLKLFRVSIRYSITIQRVS